MLRTIFVLAIVLVGTGLALQSPFYALLFYLWNAYFRPEQWVWSPLVASLKLSFTIGVFLVGAVIVSRQHLRFNVRALFLVVYLAHTLLASVGSVNQAYSLGHWTEFFKVILISYLIMVLVTDRQRFRLTVLVIAFSLGLEAAKQGWVQFLVNPGGRNMNMHPVLGDNNGVAQGMMMLAPWFLALAQTATPRWERWLHRFMLVGVLLRGIATYSRGGFLTALAIGSVLVARSRQRFVALLAAVLLAAVIVPVMPQEFWERIGTITTDEEEMEGSARGRIHFWEVAVSMANTYPLAGVGFNAYKQAYDTFDWTGGLHGTGRAVHSTWFGVLGELGYPGLLLQLVSLMLAWSAARQVRRLSRMHSELRDLEPFATALEVSLIAYVVGGTFLNAQYSEMYWHLFALSAALLQISAVQTPAKVAPAPAAAIATSWVPHRRAS